MRIMCCVSNRSADKHGILLGMTLLCAAWCVFYGLLVCGGILGTTLISSSCVEPQSLPLTRSFTNHSCPPLPSPAHPTPCNCTHMLPSTRTLSTSLPAVNSPSFIWAASFLGIYPSPSPPSPSTQLHVCRSPSTRTRSTSQPAWSTPLLPSRDEPSTRTTGERGVPTSLRQP